MSNVLTTRTRKAIAAVTLVAAGMTMTACGTGSEASTSSASASKPKPVAAIDALQGESTKITLDQGFVDALTSLKLTPGTVGEGKLANGALDFPITGGNVTVYKPGTVSPYVIGQIQHEGSGLSLTAGKTKVELTNFNVDPGVSRVYGDVSLNGKPVVSSAYLFTLNGNTLKPLATEGQNAVLEGTKVFISPVAADLLNKVFGTDAVTGELLVGIAKITVNTTPAS